MANDSETTGTLPVPPHALLDGASLFLDFDGTLAELAPTPDAVVVAPGLPALLGRLAERLDGRIAIVSGRPVAQIAALLPGIPLAISGSHGLELRWPGEPEPDSPPPAWIDAAARAAEAVRARHPGVVVEIKSHGIALHYRQAPDAADACHAAAAAMVGPGRHLQPGKMVIEVRADGGDKGTALGAFMADPRMAGGRPLFIGDDLTDEPAFAAAARLGGGGILVGPPRDTAATHILPHVAATIGWLEDAVTMGMHA